MKKALAVGLAAAMAVSMTAPVYAEGDGVAKEDLKVGIIYIGDENEGYSAAHMAGIDEMVENLGLEEDQVIEKTLIGENEKIPLRKGDSFFLPANSGSYRVEGNTVILKTRVGTI